MKTFRLCFTLAAILLPGTPSLESSPGEDSPAAASQEITVDASAPSHPFPHFWEKMFGSGRAILTLRDSYRDDLRETKRITGFEYVRFHAIFHDEAGLYDEDNGGRPVYNFSYIDQIYDGLLQNHVRPFIELSFMPKKLASDPAPFMPSGTSKTFPRLKTVTSGSSSSRISRAISSSATASTRSHSGISKSGTSPISTSGPAIQRKPLTTISTTTPLVPSNASARASALAAPPPRKLPGWTASSRTARKKTFRWILPPPTSTGTTKPKTSSARTKIFPVRGWSAARSRKSTTRSPLLPTRTLRSFGASS